MMIAFSVQLHVPVVFSHVRSCSTGGLFIHKVVVLGIGVVKMMCIVLMRQRGFCMLVNL